MKMQKFIGQKFDFFLADDYIILKRCFDLSVVISSISNHLTEYLKLVNFGFKSKNVKFAIIIDINEIDKFKKEDEETNLERLIFICNQFESNELNLNFGIFSYEKPIPFLTHEVFNSFWPFKKKWIGDKNQIMIKKNSSVGYDGHFCKTRNMNLKLFYEYAEKNNLNVVEFDYTNKFDFILDNMIHSKFVVSERSSLCVMATFALVPLYIVTERKMSLNIEQKERLITYGNGNLTTSKRIDHVLDGKITQSYFDGPIYNITPNDNL